MLVVALLECRAKTVDAESASTLYIRYVYHRRELDVLTGGSGEVGSAERQTARKDEGDVCDIISDGRDLSRGNLDVSPPPQSAQAQGSAC